MSLLKPLKLYHRGPSPNPWKVLIIIEELGLPYQLVRVDDVKSKSFLAINPNGRVPALEDPNTGITTWESGSNIDYLVETYDKTYKISHSSIVEKSHARNWAHFQMSGQGPYFGQKAWFTNYHPEKVQSAIDRYVNEIKRVLGVLELHLSTTKQRYLVGDRISYADLMWVPWNSLLPWLLGAEFDFKTAYPETYLWNERVTARESVRRMEAAKAEAVSGNA